jgi:hypothetical protein
MKCTLIDQWERVQEVWIKNPSSPELVDEQGRSVLFLEDLGFGQRRRNIPGVHEPAWKRITDAFIVRPTSGLSLRWLDYSPEEQVFQFHFERFREAFLVLTGKLLIGVSK